MASLVSVIIPTYGRPDFLERAIKSVLRQTHTNIEIIVVDDNPVGSPERLDTEILMTKFQHIKNIVYVKHECNKRVAAARNTGAGLARGDYIAFLDDDDEYYARKIEKQVDFLGRSSLYNGCYCCFESFSNNKLTRRSSYKKQGNLVIDVYKFLCTGNASCYMFKRDAFMSLGGFNEELSRHEDFELLVRFFNDSLMGFVDYFGVKRNTDSRINMPSVQQYICIKKQFFASVEKDLKKLPGSTEKKIRKVHEADIFFYCLRKKEVTKAMVYYPGFFASLSYLKIKLPNIKEIIKRNFLVRI